MKTACVLAALVGSASAFAPAGKAATTSALQMSSIPEGYDDLVGLSEETGKKFVSLKIVLLLSSDGMIVASLPCWDVGMEL